MQRLPEVVVKVGDVVEVGDLIVVQDTTVLQRELERAELDFESARLDFAKLGQENKASEIAAAEANLRSAEENLANVQAGPTEQEMAASQSNVASAWAKYNELRAAPSEAKINESRAALLKAEVAMNEAQSAYNKIKWRNDAGMTAEAATLQKATIDYESAKASFEQVNQPTVASELQSALSAAQTAQDQLDQLKLKPTAADLTTAEATLADAQDRLEKLTNPSLADLGTAEVNVKKAMIRLDETQLNLQNAQLLAPISGTVLSVDVEPGQSGSPGMTAVTLADTSQLKLTINVAEVDIPRLNLGQDASVNIDALRGEAFTGVVDTIAPSSQSGSGVVNYSVTIQLSDLTNRDVRPGMTAEATLQQEEQVGQSQWLVPNSALQSQNGQTLVQVQREDGLANVSVVPGEIHGEWTMVQTDELGSGDQVVGNVASFVAEEAIENEDF